MNDQMTPACNDACNIHTGTCDRRCDHMDTHQNCCMISAQREAVDAAETLRYKKLLTNPDLLSHIPEDELDDFVGYEGFEFESEAQRVADVLYEHYSEITDAAGFMFGFDCNSEREISGYQIGVVVDGGFYLAEYHDMKNATCDRAATGEAAAIALAQGLDGDYQHILEAARSRGLVSGKV